VVFFLGFLYGGFLWVGALILAYLGAEFATQINAETDKWTKLAKAINLKPQ
jgi:hypothetical protein